MSDKKAEETSIIVLDEDEPETKPVEEVKTEDEIKAPIPEVMVRDTTKDVSYCCVRSWSCCLNCIEGICTGLSVCCIGMSGIALGCNALLEKIDCDKR